MNDNKDILLFPNGEIMRDKNGNPLCKNMDVEMPEPDFSDSYNHSFCGTIIGSNEIYITVRDSENEYFHIEPYRVQIYVEPSWIKILAHIEINRTINKS